MSVHIDSGRLGLPAIVVHGGAGIFAGLASPEGAAVLLEALHEATDIGWEVLQGGGRSIDAITEAVASLEDSGRFNAGRGGVPTRDGTVEFDAAVMDGSTGATGALCAVSYPANPIRAARALAEIGGVPDGPVLLAGRGAERFCEEQHLRGMRPEWLTGVAGADHLPDRSSAEMRDLPVTGAFSTEGTVGAVAVDVEGHVAAATSTGGRAGQWMGRVGDSPIPGAGVFADASGVAVSATGAGEAFLVTGFAHRVAWSIAVGRGVVAAVEEGLGAVASVGGSGGGIAITPTGEFACGFSSPAMARSWRGQGGHKAHLYRR
ncbi:MAG: isoaspartyl peptidase/L-asparaginase family protein [Acidimicrobiales bacterium]